MVLGGSWSGWGPAVRGGGRDPRTMRRCTAPQPLQSRAPFAHVVSNAAAESSLVPLARPLLDLNDRAGRTPLVPGDAAARLEVNLDWLSTGTSRRRRVAALSISSALGLLGALGLSGCPSEPVEPDAYRMRPDAAAFDAFDPTLDAFRPDAFLDPRTDAYLLDVNVDAVIPVLPDSGRPDAPFIDAAPDGGPIVACEGTPMPAEPCVTNEDCAASPRRVCRLPIAGRVECRPGMTLIRECTTDLDCMTRAVADAGTDAGVELDAGPPPVLVCNTYGATCAWPQSLCEPVCEGPACPHAGCDTDGYVCPPNSACMPSDRMADDHGCVSRPCRTTADCECGFCTSLGLCASGMGTCE